MKKRRRSGRPENFADQSLFDPVGFSEKFLYLKLWEKQIAIARALVRNRRVVARACHSSGKSCIAAALALWWLVRWPGEGAVVTTASTWLQVKAVLWREIHRLTAQSGLEWPKLSATELHLGENNFAIGISTKEPTRFQGIHTPHLLVVMDEAPGIDPEIWQAAYSLLASGDSRLLVIGNPTSAVGPFYDLFDKGEGWEKFAISAFDLPTLKGLTPSTQPASEWRCEHDNTRVCAACGRDGVAWSFLCSAEWVQEQLVDWGTEHPFWVTRVLGDFATEDSRTMFPLAALQQAEDPCDHDHRGSELTVGIDVAGGGADDTVVQVCAGWCRIAARHFPEKDPREAVLTYLGPYRERIREVRVDATGIGYYFAHHLMDNGLPVVFVYVGGSSSDPLRWRDKRAEIYSKAAQAVKDRVAHNLGVTVVSDPETMDDLKNRGIEIMTFADKTVSELAQVRNEFASGRVQIESKTSLKERGHKSPDWGDAYVLAGSEGIQSEEILLVARAMGMVPVEEALVAAHLSHEPKHGPEAFQRHFTKEMPFASRLMQQYLKALEKYGQKS